MTVPVYDFLSKMVPLLVQVELTEACNLKCRFCYHSQAPRHGQRVIEILDALADQKVMQVNLTGGEPLSHPDFPKILEYACSRFPNVVLLTNGALMKKEMLDFLHRQRLMSVNISIHGRAEVHDSLTGISGSHETSINAIKYFLNRDRILVASNFVLNAFNYDELKPTIAYMEKLGSKFMTITRFIPVGVGKNAPELELSREQLIGAFQTVHEHLSRGAKPHIEMAEATPFCGLPRPLHYLANSCSYGFDRFYVDVHGNLLVCGLSRIPLGGNVLEKSLVEIKNDSPVFQSFIANDHLHADCRACELLSACHGGCRAATLSQGSWYKTKDVHAIDDPLTVF